MVIKLKILVNKSQNITNNTMDEKDNDNNYDLIMKYQENKEYDKIIKMLEKKKLVKHDEYDVVTKKIFDSFEYEKQFRRFNNNIEDFTSGCLIHHDSMSSAMDYLNLYCKIDYKLLTGKEIGDILENMYTFNKQLDIDDDFITIIVERTIELFSRIESIVPKFKICSSINIKILKKMSEHKLFCCIPLFKNNEQITSLIESTIEYDKDNNNKSDIIDFFEEKCGYKPYIFLDKFRKLTVKEDGSKSEFYNEFIKILEKYQIEIKKHILLKTNIENDAINIVIKYI